MEAASLIEILLFICRNFVTYRRLEFRLIMTVRHSNIAIFTTFKFLFQKHIISSVRLSVYWSCLWSTLRYFE